MKFNLHNNINIRLCHHVRQGLQLSIHILSNLSVDVAELICRALLANIGLVLLKRPWMSRAGGMREGRGRLLVCLRAPCLHKRPLGSACPLTEHRMFPMEARGMLKKIILPGVAYWGDLTRSQNGEHLGQVRWHFHLKQTSILLHFGSWI